ncbi:MAG: phosphatidate cytidylyltransferase [Candidatus Aminicenantes bacterium]|nr:phosphatidate cytidylyltransferase [Candidatus Aminicenantes bacterium]
MDFRKRAITAIILLALVLTVIQWSSPLIFFIFLQLLILASIFEFYGLVQRRNIKVHPGLGLFSAWLISFSFLWPQKFSLGLAMVLILLILSSYFLIYTKSIEKVMIFPVSVALTFLAPLYISFPLNFFYWLRSEYGPKGIYFLFMIIFLGDTGAYLIGHQFGRHRLVPLASPKKTVEGAIAGLIWAAAGAFLGQLLFWPSLSFWLSFFLGLVTHAVAQIADPFESLFKRAAGVKDSSNLLPGHGGFLDRLDSFLLATPVYYYLLYFFRP